MKQFPTNFSDDSVSLNADYDDFTNKVIKELDERGFAVNFGLTEALVDKITELSKQKHIREYCPRDCTGQRFATRQSAAKWLASGHAFFSLIKKESNEVIGYGWSGVKSVEQVPGADVTFAVRLAEAGLGQKLSLPFSQVIIGATAAMFEAKNFWLETWQSNGGAVHVYEELGFEHVTEHPGQRPTAAGGVVDDVRLFMKKTV